jgi:hypothetical protein
VQRKEDGGKGVGHGHVLELLEVLSEDGSMRSWSRRVQSARAKGAGINAGNDSATVGGH